MLPWDADWVPPYDVQPFHVILCVLLPESFTSLALLLILSIAVAIAFGVFSVGVTPTDTHLLYIVSTPVWKDVISSG